MAKTANQHGNRILWTEEGTRAKPKKMKLGLFFLFALLMFFFIGGALFYVWSRIQVIQLGYEISDALKEGRTVTEANKELRLQIATLKSYARIEKFAIEELKMAKPEPEQVIVIR